MLLVTSITVSQFMAMNDTRANSAGRSSNQFEQSFQFNVKTFQGALERVLNNINARVELRLADGSNLVIELYDRTDSSVGTPTLTGTVVGQPQSHVRLSVTKNGVLHGHISVRDANGQPVSYFIHHRNDTHYEFETITTGSSGAPDPTTLEFVRSNVGNDAVVSQRMPEADPSKHIKRKPRVGDPDNGDTIDLLVVYTREAKAYIGSNFAIKEAIRRNVLRTNFAFVDSDINTQIRLLDIVSIGPFPEGRVRFRQLGTVGDGVVDTLPALRDEYAADLVMVISKEVHDASGASVCGQAAIPNLTRDPKGDYAGYSWLSAYCLEGAITFAHELGHNLNAQHQRNDPYVYGANKPKRSNFAFMAPSRKYRTIMDSAQDCIIQTCPPVRLFSTPRVRPYGNRIGRPTADNARSINQFRSRVAAYRVTKRVEPPSVWTRSVNGRLDRTNPVVHFSANGTDVEAWRIFSTEYASGVAFSNTEIYPASTQRVELDLLALSHAASPRMQLQLDYRKDGRWIKGRTTNVIVQNPDLIRIDDEIKWLVDVLRGWKGFYDPATARFELHEDLISLRTFALRGDETAAERVIREIRQRTDGCRQRSNSNLTPRPDSNDVVRSCWAQQELQHGLKTLGHHVDTLEKKGFVRGWRDRCLQVKSRNSSAVVIEDCSTAPIAEQTWELTNEGKMISGGRCLDAGALDAISGKNVKMAACVSENIDRQRWFLDDDRLISAVSQLSCLTVEGPHPRPGIAIETNQCTDNVAWQKWTLSEN